MIPIRNVYYLLAYAFESLFEQELKDVATEEFANAADLLAALLCRCVATQIKRGMRREYVAQEENLASPRGRILVAETLKTQTLRRKELACDFDEFSPDAPFNRVVKSTLTLLLRTDVAASRKRNVAKILLFFDSVKTCDLRRVDWNVRFDRNSRGLQTLWTLCKLVVDGLLQTTSDGATRLASVFDEQTEARLYERFVFNYFRREWPELKARSPLILWRTDDGSSANLPTMRTDVVISNAATKKTLIIDAKYYSRNMQTSPFSRVSTPTHCSGNLYQIFAYVKNWPVEPGETVAGALLYAGTDAPIQPNDDYQICGSSISVKTLDLNRDFREIAAQLDAIAASLTT